MKNQYCFDARDYFKYDLLESLSGGLSTVDQLTCVWMLTADDTSGHGHLPFVPQPALLRINQFFTVSLAADNKDLRAMRDYFQPPGFNRRFCSYRDGPPHLRNSNRAEYFRQIHDSALQRAVVIFDPDNGMEPTTRTNRHLGFDELSTVFRRMDTDSVAVVFQFARRVADFWAKLARQFSQTLSEPVACIAEGNVAFYVIAKNGNALSAIDEILGEVSRRGRRSWFRT